jgi:hypothetical protein
VNQPMMADRSEEAMFEMGKIRKFLHFSFGLMDERVRPGGNSRLGDRKNWRLK